MPTKQKVEPKKAAAPKPKQKTTPTPTPASSPAYSIDKNIPLIGNRSSDSYRKYPLEFMEIGDSFLIPKGDENGSYHRIVTAVKAFNKLFNKNIAISRKELHEGTRVWRVK